MSKQVIFFSAKGFDPEPYSRVLDKLGITRWFSLLIRGELERIRDVDLIIHLVTPGQNIQEHVWAAQAFRKRWPDVPIVWFNKTPELPSHGLGAGKMAFKHVWAVEQLKSFKVEFAPIGEGTVEEFEAFISQFI